MTLRSLTPTDADLICRHREQIFRESGRDEATLHKMAPAFRSWLLPRLHNGSYFGFALTGSADVSAAPGKALVTASIGLMEIDWPPHPSHPLQDQRGYVLNLYVEPGYRQQGLARQLMAAAEQEFTRRGIQFAILHATAQGKPLYDAIGWHGTNEMAKQITASDGTKD